MRCVLGLLKNSVRIAVFILATCGSVPAQMSAAKNIPCPTRSATTGWKTYVDRVHGFCFSFPSAYRRTRKATDEPNRIRLQHRRLDARIFVLFENKPFNLQRFVKSAPTGYETPPEPMQIGDKAFYYYGAGGGGASYPDRYFFNLKGKTLYNTFDGPYLNSKSPSAETMKLEPKVLATLRTF